MRVTVTGGTGLLGRAVVRRFLEASHEVVVLSRDPDRATDVPAGVALRRADLRDGASLAAAFADGGAGTVVHCATDPRAAADVDVAGTAALVQALATAGADHLVHVSIVGVDRVPIGLYRAKWRAEQVVVEGGVPWTVQRATQFHPFLDQLLGGVARLPVVPCPRGLRFQPVSEDDVAERLVQHVDQGPTGRAPDLGGPEVLPMRELTETWLRAHDRRRVLLPAPLPGPVGRAFREGLNLCPEQASSGLTWREYLARAAHPAL